MGRGKKLCTRKMIHAEITDNTVLATTISSANSNTQKLVCLSIDVVSDIVFDLDRILITKVRSRFSSICQSRVWSDSAHNVVLKMRER